MSKSLLAGESMVENDFTKPYVARVLTKFLSTVFVIIHDVYILASVGFTKARPIDVQTLSLVIIMVSPHSAEPLPLSSYTSEFGV